MILLRQIGLKFGAFLEQGGERAGESVRAGVR